MNIFNCIDQSHRQPHSKAVFADRSEQSLLVAEPLANRCEFLATLLFPSALGKVLDLLVIHVEREVRSQPAKGFLETQVSAPEEAVPLALEFLLDRLRPAVCCDGFEDLGARHKFE